MGGSKGLDERRHKDKDRSPGQRHPRPDRRPADALREEYPDRSHGFGSGLRLHGAPGLEYGGPCGRGAHSGSGYAAGHRSGAGDRELHPRNLPGGPGIPPVARRRRYGLRAGRRLPGKRYQGRLLHLCVSLHAGRFHGGYCIHRRRLRGRCGRVLRGMHPGALAADHRGAVRPAGDPLERL